MAEASSWPFSRNNRRKNSGTLSWGLKTWWVTRGDLWGPENRLRVSGKNMEWNSPCCHKETGPPLSRLAPWEGLLAAPAITSTPLYSTDLWTSIEEHFQGQQRRTGTTPGITSLSESCGPVLSISQASLPELKILDPDTASRRVPDLLGRK